MLDLEIAQQANLIDEGLAIDNEIMVVEPFASEALITLCMKCLTYRHVAKQCKRQERCRYCGGPKR